MFSHFHIVFIFRWLDEHESNVAVVHCKAGKGRTGLMICAYLLHRRLYSTADEVLQYYGSVRTQDQKGVTIPSQRRYVDYYAAMMHEKLQYNPVKMYLTSIVIDPLPQLASLGQLEGYIQFEVRQTSVRPFSSDVYLVKRTDGRINIELQNPLLIVGDVKIDFTQKIKLDIMNIMGRPRYVSNGKLFHFWVNTFFIEQHRSTHLTHDSTVSVPRPQPTLQAAPESKHSRSAHNSGSTPEVGASPLPPPRKLGPSLSSGDPRSRDVSAVQSEDPDQGERSTNGSYVPSSQFTIHSHQQGRYQLWTLAQHTRVTRTVGEKRRYLATSSTCRSATTSYQSRHKPQAGSLVPRTLPTSLSWRNGIATPASPDCQADRSSARQRAGSTS